LLSGIMLNDVRGASWRKADNGVVTIDARSREWTATWKA
jgi:hypothetical protein